MAKLGAAYVCFSTDSYSQYPKSSRNPKLIL
jgi:hypothetical protein